MSRPRRYAVAGVLAMIVLAAAAVVGGYAITHVIRTHGHSTAAPVPGTPAAYRAAKAPPSTPTNGSSAAPEPAPAALAKALGTTLSASGLGSRLRARIVDVATGAVLLDRAGTAGAAPASTAKLLTAAAVLTVHRATDRIATRVVAGSGATVVLVGGGDPTLSGAAAGKAPDYPSAARISDLAAQLRRAHVRPSKIIVDDSLFTGPPISPAWAPEDVPSDYASAITPVLTDGGRAEPDAGIRSAAPDLAAGHELAAALGQPKLSIARGSAGASRQVLATVNSAPYGVLVAQMLQQSDNVIAECLARQVALAEHRPASFSGAATAVRTVLTGLGVDPGAGLVDGSGLAARDRISAATLAGVMRLVAGSAHPALHTVLAGMPVAGWSGTLVHRYVTGTAGVAAGVVRAKTGTLTGVSTLAGTVHDRSGRLLAFALLADRTGPTPSAEDALDAIVARLSRCGCT